MGVSREVLLWASRNAWLQRQFQRRAFAKRAVKRFMPGETAEAALNAAKSFRDTGITTIFTMLGENVTTGKEVEDVTAQYLNLYDQIQKQALPSQISVKPTQLGLDLSVDLCLEQLTALAHQAAGYANMLWVDMEASPYVDRTLDLVERVRQTHENIGVCLQAYMHRARDDLERLMTKGIAIRLVKGAYKEPSSVALQRRRDVDANYLLLAIRLLEALESGRGVFSAFATHDVSLLSRILDEARRRGVANERFEVEMLYGIGREHQLRLADRGHQVRVLISYGPSWYPWYMRRLAERPANVFFVMRSLAAR